MTPTALLIMDVRQGTVARFAGDAGYLDRLRPPRAATASPCA
jgi:hypothetical protein